MSDLEMVRRYLDGDIRYLGELYAKYQARTLACARAILHNQDQAMDCVSDAWLAIREELPGYDPKRSFLKWALGITRHKALDARRRLVQECGRHVPLDDIGPDTEPTGPSQEEEHGRLLLREQLVRALEKLPPAQSNAIMLQFEYGLSYREIGKRCGRSPSTVGSDIRRGYERLRTELAPLIARTASRKDRT